MSDMLELWPRQHDLPPRWDGMPVEWGEWSDPPMICPPPKPEKCKQCGSTEDRKINLGRVWTEPGMVASIGRARMNGGRHLVGNLSAFRCPDCGHDYVLDIANGEAWDLDPTDYTDDGSWDVN